MKTIVTSYFGSKLYGTDTATPDTGYYRIIIPSAQEIIFGNDTIQTCSSNSGKNNSVDEDLTIITLKKYIEQCMIGELNAISLLYAPEQSLIDTSLEWSYLQAHRDKFITTRMKLFGFIYSGAKQIYKKEVFKRASNILRAIEQVNQLFTVGFITYPIKNANLIKAIKNEEIQYQEVLKLIDDKLKSMEEVKAKNIQNWPEEVCQYNKNFFHDFIYEVYKESIYRTL